MQGGHEPPKQNSLFFFNFHFKKALFHILQNENEFDVKRFGLIPHTAKTNKLSIELLQHHMGINPIH